MSLQCGIVGLPNVGKSTLFNALTKAGIAAENYPFCTIEPNVGIVEVPDPRLAALSAIVKPERVVPAVVEDGPPWEFRGERGVLAALLETIRLFLLEPTIAFTAMRRTGGVGAPLFYYVILGSVAGMAVILYQAVWQSVGTSEPSGGEAMLSAWMSSPVIIGASIVMLPLYVIFEAFFSSLLTHGALLLVGGARRPFQATFRVVSYAGGSSYVLQLLPLIGVLAAIAGNLVLKVIGLAVVHEISRTRAAVAVILPALIFLLFWAAIAVLATTALLSAIGQAMQGG